MKGLVVCAIAGAACSDVDLDLLGPQASPCDLGEVGAWVDVTPPGVVPTGSDPGVRAIALDPIDRSVLYAATHGRGVWRTGDCGATWEHMNTGINGPIIEGALAIDLGVDPFVPDTLYITPRFGGNSMWWSTNAGVHWDNMIPPDIGMGIMDVDVADLGRFAVDPTEPHHVIVSSMVGWTNFGGDAGILEGRLVGDAWQWTVHPPAAGMGTAQYLAFLDSHTWMVTSTYVPTGEGTWITRDAGATFARIDDHEAASGWQLYRSPDGTLYRPAQFGLLRSTDGETWTDVFVGLGLGGSQAIIGDGETLLVSSSVPDGDLGARLFAAPEQPGDRNWERTGEQSTTSVQRFVRDELRSVIYAHNGTRGIQRMRMR